MRFNVYIGYIFVPEGPFRLTSSRAPSDPLSRSRHNLFHNKRDMYARRRADFLQALADDPTFVHNNYDIIGSVNVLGSLPEDQDRAYNRQNLGPVRTSISPPSARQKQHDIHLGCDAFFTNALIGMLVTHYYRVFLPGPQGHNMIECCYIDDPAPYDSEVKGTIVHDAHGLPMVEYLKMNPSADVILGIVEQVLANLAFMRRTLKFRHNNLDTTRVILNGDDCVFTYGPWRVNNEISALITDYSRSSVTLNVGDKSTMIYRFDQNMMEYESLYPYKRLLEGSEWELLPKTFSKKTVDKLLGAGLDLPEPWDYYTFMITLASNWPAFFTPEASFLRAKYWDPLWISNAIEKRLKPGMTAEDVPAALAGLKIRQRVPMQFLDSTQ